MKAMAKTGPLALIDERYFVPRDLDEARSLRKALVASGAPLAQAKGIVMWLVELTGHRSDDPHTDRTRSQYRQALARLGEPPWGWDPGRSKGAYNGSPVRKSPRP